MSSEEVQTGLEDEQDGHGSIFSAVSNTGEKTVVVKQLTLQYRFEAETSVLFDVCKMSRRWRSSLKSTFLEYQ